MRWRCLLLAATLLSACRLSPAAEPARDTRLVIPVYNDAGLMHATTTLKPHLRAGDRFMLVSGNIDGRIDTAWLNASVLELREAYPTAPIYAATSGLANIAEAAVSVSRDVEALVYVYEPNFPNQPEFSWDFGTTTARFGDARALIASGGFRAVGKPTGRPLLQPSLQEYGWDYGELAGAVDELFIQTQTYCKDDPAAFAEAIDALTAQYRDHAQTRPWVPQITVDPGAYNGTTVAQAQACWQEARARGVSNVLLWWSPSYAERAVSFIAALNGE